MRIPTAPVLEVREVLLAATARAELRAHKLREAAKEPALLPA